MQDLDQRIRSLRQLLNNATSTTSLAPEPEAVEMFQGHAPAHAAPGPLLDELALPEHVVRLDSIANEDSFAHVQGVARLDNADQASPKAVEHAPAHALSAKADEVARLERDESIRLQA